MKVAIYARVSTSDKEQEPETQLMPLRDFCLAQGWEVYREYVDQALAGPASGAGELHEKYQDHWPHDAGARAGAGWRFFWLITKSCYHTEPDCFDELQP